MASAESASEQVSAGPPGTYEVVYVKDNVSVHPSPLANERISGRLKLIKQGQSVFLTWIPYNQSDLPDDSTLVLSSDVPTVAPVQGRKDKDRNLYTIRAVSISEIRSIRRHTPTLGWNYIIVVLTTGLAFPPLYFNNGGVKEFLGVLKEHALLVRSAEDANVYLVNDIQDPLQKSLTSLDLPDAVTPVRELEPLEEEAPKEGAEEMHPMVVSRRGPEEAAINRLSNSKHVDPLRDASLHILTQFSKVTKFVREATTQISGYNDRPLSRSGMLGLPERAPPARQASVGLSEALPEKAVASENGNGMPGLLEADKDEPEMSSLGSFELVDGSEEESPALVWGRPRPPPLGAEEWATFLDSEGRVSDPAGLRKRVFHGGVEPDMRREVWKFLLGYFPYESTRSERKALQADKGKEYGVLKSQWQSVSEDQAKKFAKFRERKSRVDKDVVRTDRTLPFYEGDENPNVEKLRDILITYSFYNFDLGYCQGMSDLLSPILYVMDDEVDAFWCFSALMETIASNFHRDQNGMHSQLLSLRKLVKLLDPPLDDYFRQVDCLNYFFCFRWILIHFKREFEYDNVLRLWEVLWSRYLSDHFHLYVCVAVLKRHRRKIMDEQMEFDTLLKFINDLSGRIELEGTLRDAEALCRYAGEAGIACMPPAPPPTDETQIEGPEG